MVCRLASVIKNVGFFSFLLFCCSWSSAHINLGLEMVSLCATQ